MKKIILMVLIAGLFFACSSSEKKEGEVKIMIGGMLPNRFVESSEYDNKDEIETEKVKLIIKAIQDKDFESLQSLFQPSAIESAETLHDDALALFDYIGIDMYEIIKIRISEEASFGYGNGEVFWNVFTEIKSNNNVYYLSFLDLRKNYSYQDDIGIKTLKFQIDDENYNSINVSYLDPGIFNPARHGSANASPL